jgi:hypothetical protein
MDPGVVMSSCCWSACFCGVVSCCCAAHVCVCWVGCTVSKLFYRRWRCNAVCVDQLITNNFIFFNSIMRLRTSCYLVVIMSCHVVSCRLNIVIMCTKFLSHIFFFHALVWLLLSSCHYFKHRSYSSSHQLASYIVIGKFFFCYHHSCCSVLLHNTRGAVRLLWPRVAIH